MKKYSIIFLLALIGITVSSCIKNDPILITDTTDPVLEWDAATYNSRAAGADYPLLVRLPGYGRPVVNTNPLITRASGTINFRINLVGAHRSEPTTVQIGVVGDRTTAIAGTHYNVGGTATIPANSSFAEVAVEVLDSEVPSTTPVDLVLEILGTSDLRPSPNHYRLGVRIAQN